MITVKLIAQDDDEVASDLEADKDNAIDKLINTLAIQSMVDENPVGLLTDAFSWKDSPEGAEYWENITTEFAERHSMVGEKGEDEIPEGYVEVSPEKIMDLILGKDK